MCQNAKTSKYRGFKVTFSLYNNNDYKDNK